MKRNLLLAAGAVAFSLLLAEGLIRALGLSSEKLGVARVANTKGTEVRAGTLALICYPTNPRGYFDIDLRDPATLARYRALGMRNLDRVRFSSPFAVEHRYNSMVFRGGEFPVRRPGVRRVIVIGDSFTEGWGVREEDAYPRLLEARLNAAEPGRWEVLNCGRANSDFPAVYDLFTKVLALDPDIVIYGMVLNDPAQTEALRARRIHDNNLILLRDRMLEGPTRQGALRSRLVDFVEHRLEAFQIERQTIQWYRDLYGAPNRPAWRLTRDYIRRMDRQMRERGGRFLLALWPLLVNLDGSYPFLSVHQTIAAFCQDAGIEMHDLLGDLRGRRAATLWVHPVDMHPNEAAHRIAAEALAPATRSLASRPPPGALR